MAEYADYPAPATIRIKRLFDAPIDKVWAHLVESDKRARWLCAGEVEPRVGGKIVFDFDHRRLTDEAPPEKYADQGTAHMEGEVTAYDAPNHIAFLWPEEPGGEPTKVDIRLVEKDGGTELILTHERLESREFRIGATAGWHAHLDVLADELAGRERRPFWSHHMALEEVYAAREQA